MGLGHQVAYGVYDTGANYEIRYAINPVNYCDGSKYRHNDHDIQQREEQFLATALADTTGNKLADEDRADFEELRNFSYTFMRQIPKAATLYYLEKAGEAYIQGDDSIIGVPIGLYLPDRNTAIEFYKPHGNKGIYYTEEWVKNDLCRRNHITMIRLLEKKYRDFNNCICLTYLGYSLEILDLLIKQLFFLIRIGADTDMIRDIFEIEGFWKSE